MTIFFYISGFLLLDTALRIARIRDMKAVIRSTND